MENNFPFQYCPNCHEVMALRRDANATAQSHSEALREESFRNRHQSCGLLELRYKRPRGSDMPLPPDAKVFEPNLDRSE